MLFYREEFIGSEVGVFLNLSILVWAMLFVFFNYVNGYLLNSMNREKLRIRTKIYYKRF